MRMKVPVADAFLQKTATWVIRSATNAMLEYACEEDPWNLYIWVRKMADQIRPIDSIYVCRYYKDRETLAFVFESEKRERMWERGVTKPGDEQPLGTGPTSRVIRTGRRELVPPPADRNMDDTSETFCSDQRSESGIHIPIVASNGEVTGVLGCFSFTRDAFDPFFICVYELLAGWLAVCFDDDLRSSTMVDISILQPPPSPISGAKLTRQEMLILVGRAAGFGATALEKKLGYRKNVYYPSQNSAFNKIGLPTRCPPHYIRERLKELSLPLSAAEVALHFDEFIIEVPDRGHP